MENKKKVLKEFKEEITKKYGESALDIINKQLLILHKLPEINQKILIGVEDLIKRKLNKSGGADIKRISTKERRKSSYNNCGTNRDKMNATSDSIFVNNISKPTTLESFSPNRKVDNTVLTTIVANKRLASNSLKTTNVNSPIRDLSADSRGLNDSESKGPVFPLLQVKTNISDQRIGNSLHNSLYGRGFRTPIKKFVPAWDAKCIQDSNEYFKEQQMKNLQMKNNKESFKMFLDAQIKQRTEREKASQEITKQDYNNMVNNVGNKEKREQYMEDLKRK